MNPEKGHIHTCTEKGHNTFILYLYPFHYISNTVTLFFPLVYNFCFLIINLGLVEHSSMKIWHILITNQG